MARTKKKNDEKDKLVDNTLEIKKVQEEINQELLKEEKKKEKEIENNPTYIFFTFFLKRLKEDKLYLFSFIVTIIFVSIFSYTKLKATEGYYDKKNDVSSVDNTVIPTVNEDLNQSSKNDDKKKDELDITDYVGIYSKEYKFDEGISLDGIVVNSYKLVYQIKKDKTITKYFMNDSIGTIKIWDGKLDYVSSGGARYISANNVNFLFSSSSMKEVDGETFKIDDTINSLKENNLNTGVQISFLDDNVVLMSKNNLVSVKSGSINYQLSSKYSIKSDILEQNVYNSSTNVFKFIVFEENSDKKCYSLEEIEDKNFKDSKLYTIYSIKYNEDTQIFDDEKEEISRNKSAGCDVFLEDLETLKE